MAVFPKQEMDVLALANAMVAGCQQNPALFPHAHPLAVDGAADGFRQAYLYVVYTRAMAKIKTEEEDAAFDALVANITTQLAQSEIATANDPGKLELIGWGKKTPAQPSNPPNQARAVEAIMQGPGTSYLDWKTPMTGGRKGVLSPFNRQSAIANRKAAGHSAVGNKQAWRWKLTLCSRSSHNAARSSIASSASTAPESAPPATPLRWCCEGLGPYGKHRANHPAYGRTRE